MSATIRYFHITPVENLPAILREGLQPRLGERSQMLGEPEPAIYLFTSADAVDDASMNWLGDYFDEEEALAVLAVDLSEDFPGDAENGFEFVTTRPVPPDCLSVMTEDVLGETEYFSSLPQVCGTA